MRFNNWDLALAAYNMGYEQVLDAIARHVQQTVCRSVYIANGVDGTDERWVSATGTPEAKGLEPALVLGLVGRLRREVGLWAGDVMERAPPTGTRKPLDAASNASTRPSPAPERSDGPRSTSYPRQASNAPGSGPTS